VNNSLLLCVANFLILKKYKNYKLLYTELTATFQSCRDAFPRINLGNLILYDFLLRSYITGKLRTQSINFSSNSPLQLMVYKKHNCREQATALPACCHKAVRRHAEVKDRMAQLHDAAVSAQCHGGTLTSATLKNQLPS